MKKYRSVLVSVLALTAMAFSLTSCDKLQDLFNKKPEQSNSSSSAPASSDESSDTASDSSSDSVVVTPAAGSKENPIALTVPGSVTVSYTGGDNLVWYTFTAAESKTLKVTFAEGTVMGYGVDKDEMMFTGEDAVAIEVELTAGTTYFVNFSTADLEAAEIAVSAEYVVVPTIGDLTGTYIGTRGNNPPMTVEIVSDEDLLGGTITFSVTSNNDTYVDEFIYEVVDGEFVFLNEDGSPVNTMFYNFVLEDGVPVEAVNNGYTYTLALKGSGSGGSEVEETGFEGKYTATTTVPNKTTYDVEFTSDEIIVSFVTMGQSVEWTYEYEVQAGVPVITSEHEDFTFSVNAVGQLVGMTDLFNDPDGIPYTLEVASEGGEEPEETGFEGTYNFESAAGISAVITVTSTEITLEISMYGVEATSTYTVDADGNMVLDPEGELVTEFGVSVTSKDGKLETLTFDNGFETFQKPQPKPGDNEELAIELTLVDGETISQTASNKFYGAIYYTYTSSVSGILTVTYPTADAYVSYYQVGDEYGELSGDGSYVDTVLVEVVAGVEYILKLGVCAENVTRAPRVTLSFEEKAIPVKGDFEKPYDLYETYFEDIACDFAGTTADENKYVWYAYNDIDGTVTINFNTAVNVKYGAADSLESRTGVTTLSFEVTANTYLAVQSADLAEADITFSVAFLAKKGTASSNPFDAVLGENAFSYEADSTGLYYAYTFTKDCSITVTIASAGATISSPDKDDLWTELNATTSSAVITMQAGQKMIISIYADEDVTGTLTLTELLPITIQYGTYTNTMGFTVIINESTVTVTYKNPFYGTTSSTRVDAIAWTKDDVTKTITIEGVTKYSLAYDDEGNLTKFNDNGTDRALTKSA